MSNRKEFLELLVTFRFRSINSIIAHLLTEGNWAICGQTSSQTGQLADTPTHHTGKIEGIGKMGSTAVIAPTL